MWRENRSSVRRAAQNGELDTEQQSPGDSEDIQSRWFLGDAELLFLWSMLHVKLWGSQTCAWHAEFLINAHSVKNNNISMLHSSVLSSKMFIFTLLISKFKQSQILSYMRLPTQMILVCESFHIKHPLSDQSRLLFVLWKADKDSRSLSVRR